MNPIFTIKTLSLICGILFCTMAHGQAQLMQWDRDNAMAAVRSVNIDVAVRELGDISSLGNAATTLDRLERLETRRDWPLPAREAAVFAFTRSLADLPRDAVAAPIMQHLKNYQAQTLVPHEDHDSAFVPLFNIRGAAAGVENGWQRSEFETRAITLLENDPAKLVTGYLALSNDNQRSGYLDALRQAGVADVMSVQDAALDQLVQAPALSGILQVTTVVTTDTLAVQQLLAHGQGAGLSSALVQLGEQLPRSEIASLLVYAIQRAPAGNATLAIAAWWPRLSHDSEIRDLMVATLSDPSLGASAALALAQAPDIQTIRALQETASGESLAAKRAQMALDLNRDGLAGGVRP